MSNDKPSRTILLAAFVLFTLLFAFNAATADQGAVQLKSLTTDEKLFSATACVELPSIDPWWPEVALEIDGEPMPEIGITLIDAKKPETMRSRNRCYLFEIPIQPRAERIGTAVFRIVSVLLDRQPDLASEAYISTLKNHVQKTVPELDFKIETVQAKMGGGIKLTISAKPDDMTEEEATRIIRQSANLEFPINWELPVHVY